MAQFTLKDDEETQRILILLMRNADNCKAIYEHYKKQTSWVDPDILHKFKEEADKQREALLNLESIISNDLYKKANL